MANENRKNQRVQWFMNVYPKGSENTDTSIGIVTNISKAGVNIWLDRAKTKVNSHLSVRLPPPDEMLMDPIDIDLETVWDKFHQELGSHQLGCQFINITSEQTCSLAQLISYLEAD